MVHDQLLHSDQTSNHFDVLIHGYTAKEQMQEKLQPQQQQTIQDWRIIQQQQM